MARDLIPPPSPAGRPAPEGTATHRFVELPPEPVAEALEPQVGSPEKAPLPPSEHRHRFGFLAGALGAVLLASIAVAVALFAWNGDGDGDENLYPNWSKWQPTDSSLAGGALQIASHVSRQYNDGQTPPKQLVDVKAMAGPASITLHSTVVTDLSGDTVVYQMKGFAEGGAIDGKASTRRGAVVFREALELSLYTFKYMKNVESVVSLLPPPAENQNLAVFLQRKHLEDALGKPLRATLPAAPPYFLGDIEPAEQRTINKYTELQFFRSGFELAPDQSVVLNLEVPTAS